MDYQRNSLYFKPIPVKFIGLSIIKTILTGVLCLMAGIFLFNYKQSVEQIVKKILDHEVSRYNEITNVIITIGIFLVVFGILLIIRITIFNKNRTVISDDYIDNTCKNYLNENLKKMALKKLGIDENQVCEVTPICVDGYYYRKLSDFPNGVLKQGEDGKWRSSIYNAVIFLFSPEEVFCYYLQFSLLEDVKKEITDVCFYRDVVSVSTSSDIASFGEGVGKFTINFEDFILITTGGTKMRVSFFDTNASERSIQGMRHLLRSKKSEK